MAENKSALFQIRGRAAGTRLQEKDWIARAVLVGGVVAAATLAMAPTPSATGSPQSAPAALVP